MNFQVSRPILILGATGKLGKVLCRHWKHVVQAEGWNHAVLGLGSSDFDFERDESQLWKSLSSLSPCVVVNAAAMSGLEACEQNPDSSLKINARAPRHLASWCQAHEVPFLHFSTDYVFGGEEPSLKTENDAALPGRDAGWYARSKKMGEESVLEIYPETLIARVSWLFGPGGDAFPDQMIAKAQRGEPLSAISGKWSVPTYTLDLARWLWSWVRGGLKRDAVLLKRWAGIVHACHAGSCTWLEYAQSTLQIAKRLGILHQVPEMKAIPLEECSFFQCPRPKFTSMDSSKLFHLLDLKPRAWEEAMEEHLNGRWKGLSSSS